MAKEVNVLESDDNSLVNLNNHIEDVGYIRDTGFIVYYVKFTEGIMIYSSGIVPKTYDSSTKTYQGVHEFKIPFVSFPWVAISSITSGIFSDFAGANEHNHTIGASADNTKIHVVSPVVDSGIQFIAIGRWK